MSLSNGAERSRQRRKGHETRSWRRGRRQRFSTQNDSVETHCLYLQTLSIDGSQTLREGLSPKLLETVDINNGKKKNNGDDDLNPRSNTNATVPKEPTNTILSTFTPPACQMGGAFQIFYLLVLCTGITGDNKYHAPPIAYSQSSR